MVQFAGYHGKVLLIPALGRQRQEDSKFKASLDYLGIPGLQNNTHFGVGWDTQRGREEGKINNIKDF